MIDKISQRERKIQDETRVSQTIEAAVRFHSVAIIRTVYMNRCITAHGASSSYHSDLTLTIGGAGEKPTNWAKWMLCVSCRFDIHVFCSIEEESQQASTTTSDKWWWWWVEMRKSRRTVSIWFEWRKQVRERRNRREYWWREESSGCGEHYDIEKKTNERIRSIL